MPRELYNLSYGEYEGGNTGYAGWRNRRRLKLFTKIIDPQPDDKILDIGCNDGALVKRLSACGCDARGIDINKEVLKKVKDDRLQIMSATKLEFSDNTFHKVCAFEVLEHIDDTEKVLSEINRVLKPGSSFVCSFPLELFRGQSTIKDAYSAYGSLLKAPKYARELHVHRLTPGKIKKIITGRNLPLELKSYSIRFLPWPAFVVTLIKFEKNTKD